MFAYPMYQTQPMYKYTPEEYYYPLGNENGYHRSHYTYEDNSNRSNQHKRRSSIKKLRRSKSLSKIDYDDEYNYYNHPRNHGEEEYYYQSRNRLDGVRSVSPYTENRGYHHPSLNSRMHPDNEDIVTPRRRNSWVQPTSFVNLGQPMINPMTTNYQMQQSLGARPTDTWPGTNTYIPPNNNDLFFLPPQNVPMIQPYYMPPLTNNSNPFLPSVSSASSSSYFPQPQPQPHTNMFPNFMPMPVLFPELFSQPNTDTSNEVKEETQEINKDMTPNISQKNSPVVTSKEISDTDTAQPPSPAKQPTLLRRKKSFMEEILSSFSLLGEDRKYYYK